MANPFFEPGLIPTVQSPRVYSVVEPTVAITNRDDFVKMQANQDLKQENNQLIMNREIKKEKSFLIRAYGTQLGLALLSGIIVSIFLYLVNPPITQEARTDANIISRQDVKKVLVVVAIVVVLVFLIPEVLRLMKI